jgi:COP9 signalosome complex subunit 4
MLQRMSAERLISSADAAAFEATLPQHCRATDSQGVTSFGKAVAEHNLLAASRLYKNISFANLGALLGVSPEAAQRTVADMVSGGRLSATIDQVDGMIDFRVSGGGASDPDAAVLRDWDKGVKEVCTTINSLVETVGK